MSDEAEINDIIKEILDSKKFAHIVVLVYLHRVGKATLSDVRRALAGGRYRARHDWAMGILKELKERNLIKEEAIKSGREFKVVILELTDMGKKVAEKFSSLLSV